jgi:hypothetical protein
MGRRTMQTNRAPHIKVRLRGSQRRSLLRQAQISSVGSDTQVEDHETVIDGLKRVDIGHEDDECEMVTLDYSLE